MQGGLPLSKRILTRTLSIEHTCSESKKNKYPKHKILPLLWGLHADLDISWDPPNTNKRRERGGKGKPGCGSLGRNMITAKRLSRNYFWICPWRCASASRWGAVLEELVCGFAQKAARTDWLFAHPQAWTVRNGDCDCDSQGPTKPSFHSRQWCSHRQESLVLINTCRVWSWSVHTESGPDQYIQSLVLISTYRVWSWSVHTESGPDQYIQSLVLIGTYIHPGTASTKGSWDFLKKIVWSIK